MLGHDHGSTGVSEIFQVSNKLNRGGAVQHRKRLVETQNAGPAGHHCGQRQLLLLAAGEGLW